VAEAPIDARSTQVLVEPVRRAGDRREFIALPYSLHRGDPCWVPPLRRDVRAQLDKKRNPFFQHAEAEYFVARRGGSAVGRIAAVHNRRHNEFQGDRVGFFGFFECIDDVCAARALFEAAAAWLRPRGLERMRGPASFSTNDECGLLVDGFTSPPTLLMAHNPPYYGRLVEAAGFAKAKDLLAYKSTSQELPARLRAASETLRRRYAISLRAIDRGHAGDEVRRIQTLYNAAWESNWGFVPLTDREVEDLARQLLAILDPELVVFAERERRPIGLGIALPDVNAALRTNRSGRLLPGLLKIFLASRKLTRLRVLALGTLPEWRRKGVDALLYRAIWDAARRRGYTRAEAGWILEDNHAMRNGLTRMGFEVHKRYRLYERPV
jgi:GNAT superfamily N-acetyltransferase